MSATVQISLSDDQLALLETLKVQQEQIIASLNKSVWLSEQQAAERIGVSVSTIRKWRRDGWLRYKKLEKVVLFLASEFDEDIATYGAVNNEKAQTLNALRR